MPKVICSNMPIAWLHENDITENIVPLDRIHSDANQAENHCFKCLGILLDENLSFRNHVDYICKKII